MFKKLSKPFTLIELLVVITIIAILAGLVLPQLGKAQDSANRTASNNNIKALCAAVVAETGMSKGSYYKGFWDDRIWTITEEMWANDLINTVNYEVAENTPQQTKFNALYEVYTPGPSSTTEGNWVVNIKGPDSFASQEEIIDFLEDNDDYEGAIDLSSIVSGVTQQQIEYSAFEVFGQYNAAHPFLGLYVFDGRAYSQSTGGYISRGKKKLATDVRIIGEAYIDGDGLAGIGFSDGHVSLMRIGDEAIPTEADNNGIVHYSTITGNVLGALGEITDEGWQP